MIPLLAVHKLAVSFHLKHQITHAVQNLSFSLAHEEILGIVGESGCGKSAAVKALVQLHPKHATSITGRVIYGGQDLLRLRESELQKIRGKEIGLIFQDPMSSLNPTMKIGDQIMEGYLLHHRKATKKEAKEYAIELLDLVGISKPKDRLEDYPHMHSGGMRQRAMIALALAPRPKIIIADEPTTALDVTIQAQILDLMQQIKMKTGTSFILITHDMSVVAGYCDRVMVMYAGNSIETASVEELFATPTHPYTKGLLQSIPRLDMDKNQPLIPIEGSPPNLTTPPKGCPFAPRCKEVFSPCAKEKPPLEAYEENHLVACHRYVCSKKGETL